MSIEDDDTPLFLTSEVDDAVWAAFTAKLETENDEGFRAYVRFVTDEKFLGADENTIRKAAESKDKLVTLAADAMTFEHPDNPVLCIDPEGRSPSFRAKLKHLWIVENNLSIGNLFFEELIEDQLVDGWLHPDGF